MPHLEIQEENPRIYYSNRLEILEAEKSALNRKDKNFEKVRFLIFFGGLGFVVYFILNRSIAWLYTSALWIGLYLWVLQKHEGIKAILEEKLREIQVIQKELGALEGDFSRFPKGEQYIHPAHDYSSDLDLFGERSIFQYFNRSLTVFGEDRLASWFLKPATESEILNRQESVKEISTKPDWMMNFRSIKISERTNHYNLKSLLKWLSQPVEIQFPKELKYLLLFSPWIMGLIGLGIMLDFLFPEWGIGTNPYLKYLPEFLSFCFLAQLSITGKYTKRIKVLHQVLSRQSSTLFSYSAMMNRIEEETFTSNSLIAIQTKINNDPRASLAIQKLSKLLKSFDDRLNIIIAILTNGLYLSDIRLVLELEEWKENYKEKIPVWLDSVMEVEALVSLGIICFNESSWVFPEIHPVAQSLFSQEMGHPLIPISKRVNNSFEISPPDQVVLITGSNMAGKSTFLRTLGVNLVLAQMGSKVCAASFRFKPVSIYTSLRIVDSLQENTSSFYAELKRLEVLVKRSLSGENIFFLLDEILRGTNSNDRHLGSKAVIKHLIRNHVFGILATHDLSLGRMVEDFPKEIRNMHFDVSVLNEELFFDYTLKPGICTSLNASILMKKIGLDIES